MKEMGAIRVAGDYANALLSAGAISQEQWSEVFKNKAHEIYNFNCVPF